MSRVFTNIQIFEAIAKEAYLKMIEFMKQGCRPKLNGGYINKYDPKHASFKQAMIVIVFVGIWLESYTHLLIFERHGLESCKKYDREIYEEKLKILKIMDKNLLDCVTRFRESRNMLIHEKAHLGNVGIRTAQDEAENAYQIFCKINDLFKN